MRARMDPILPKPKGKSPIEEALRLGMIEGGRILKAAAERVVSTWQDKPVFTVHVKMGKTARQGIQCYLTSDDPRWKWIDEGTGQWGPHKRKYVIAAKRAKALVFPSMFTPKSQPNSLKAGGGFSGGTPVVRPYVVHPGIKPRNFSKLIHKRYHTAFKKAVAARLAQWARSQ